MRRNLALKLREHAPHRAGIQLHHKQSMQTNIQLAASRLLVSSVIEFECRAEVDLPSSSGHCSTGGGVDIEHELGLHVWIIKLEVWKFWGAHTEADFTRPAKRGNRVQPRAK